MEKAFSENRQESSAPVDTAAWAECLREVGRFLPHATPEEREAFARRQLRARQRQARISRFYRAYPSLMARTHLLAACALTLGRFCGYSPTFDRIGEVVNPAGPDGKPRTPAWEQYAHACELGRPWEVIEELWVAAHIADLEQARAAGELESFVRDAALHPDDPTWQALRLHLEVTLGARAYDADALAGRVPYETAMAETMLRSVPHLLKAGWPLMGRFARETARAFVTPALKVESGAVGYRACAWELLRYTVLAWMAARVYRQGMRQKERGRLTDEIRWPLLTQVLRERVHEVHPAIDRFYQNPSHYDVTASLDLRTGPIRLLSRLATFVTGQGLYEQGQSDIAARFRVFRRPDGSMRFLRELYCGSHLRVFDADFVIRRIGGQLTLCEVFPRLHVVMAFNVTPLPEGGLLVHSRAVYWCSLRLPMLGLRVEFESGVGVAEDGGEELHFTGRLLMQPRARWGRFLAHRVLRRPETLGCLTYTARPDLPLS